MTLESLLETIPELKDYLKNMPESIRTRHTIRTYAPGEIIHQKHSVLDRFGIVCSGEHRVINEFENGNIFMIEKNEAISFIGEVTLLADQDVTSVTIEATTECVIIYIPVQDFFDWISADIHFLRIVSEKIAKKLYRSSFNRGSRLFYSASYLLLRYVIQYAETHHISKKQKVIVNKTRQQLYEEVGMTVKTINRTITKLKNESVIGIEKGKIVITRTQYEAALNNVDYYVNQNKKGQV